VHLIAIIFYIYFYSPCERQQIETKELKIVRDHLMPCSSVCTCGRVYMLAHGLARTDSVLGYDHRGLPRASAERANLTQDGHWTEKVKTSCNTN